MGRIEMNKILVTKQELQDWLTSEIQKYEGCETCKLTGVMGLQELDGEGCNWSDTLYLNQSGIPSEILHNVIQAARAKFNISD